MAYDQQKDPWYQHPVVRAMFFIVGMLMLLGMIVH